MNKQIYKSRNTQIRGVTIVELLIYIALLMIFMTVLLDVFTTILSARLESESTSGVSQDARFIMTKLAYDVENSSVFSVPGANTLVIGTKNYVFDSVSGNLTVNGDRLNGTDTKIDSLTFTKIGNTLKTVFTVESLVSIPSGPQTITMESTFGARP